MGTEASILLPLVSGVRMKIFWRACDRLCIVYFFVVICLPFVHKYYLHKFEFVIIVVWIRQGVLGCPFQYGKLIHHGQFGFDRYLAGDSSLDNKYWILDKSVPAVNGYEDVLQPPVAVPDVSHHLNAILAENPIQLNRRSTRSTSNGTSHSIGTHTLSCCNCKFCAYLDKL